MPATDHYTTAFFNYLKFEKRFSKHTLLAYENDLNAFFDFIALQYGDTPLAQLSHTLIRSWLAQLKQEGLTAKSINRKISTLRAFFKFLMLQGCIDKTPMAKVTAPKIEKRLPQFLSEQSMDTLLRHVEFGTDWSGHTHRLLIEIFYNTGMRLSELIGLKESGFDAGACTLKVWGKGNKERIIPIAQPLAEAIKAYGVLKKLLPGELISDHLLVTDKGKPLQPRAVYSIVKSYLSQVTTIEKKSPHILRHTFATHLTNAGADINAVKELLGHSSLAATQVYTHNTIDKLKNVYKNAHPKA